MKIIKDENAYITSILLLVMLIPVLLLLIVVIDQHSHDVNSTLDKLQSDKIKSICSDFEEIIITITKESLHNITHEIVTSNRSKTTSDEIKKHIQSKIDEYALTMDDNYKIRCKIDELNPATDPFKIEIEYSLQISTKDNKISIIKNQRKWVEITDKNYPVYDPLPTLKTGAIFREGYVDYKNKLSEYVVSDTDDVYVNVKQHIIIRECPINNYIQHGNTNQSMMFCLNNHYYHDSHDGMCLLCRLENSSSCNHHGLETFILPAKIFDAAPVSIDHVLLNDRNNQYTGNIMTINNNTGIYLDNGHKKKYGL